MAPPPDWKTTNRTIQILQVAEEGRYGVLATVAYNIEHILGMVQAAERAHSPLIIQFFPWAITFSSGLLIRTAADAASRAKVPVAIHLDHAQDEEMIRRAADTLPFDSIMIDMSHYEKETNLAKTKELVRYCHERGIATEAEPGRIEGGEDGVMDTEGLEGSMTTMEEVSDFVDTGVDFLAPAIGNMHGENPYGFSNPNLDFERLREIRSKAQGRVRIALHGTNGFRLELMKKCISEGVAKVNVNKLVLDDYSEHLKANAGKFPQTKLMEQGVELVTKQTMQWMEICGSAGKAKSKARIANGWI
ncbi:fructose-bisphosphate aldolase [Hyaloscypha bicolor E]|uniref:Fructose-bisphosphate aldolase n=1 Tax=Hyaloscypha bicolor E TaxID=1095630 RepID=A0A2J6SIP8_9HELO|nr:fructose-bisphosphate aldolase [Hyaloscypha bicolor E]PMD50644.1 fructose-bisphosphate aldolase [Hyaloscypha bicolor E]